jgi:hypothetical protein
MSRTGWPFITTPIATQPLVQSLITAPTINQILVYNGTRFVNSSQVGVTTFNSVTKTLFDAVSVNNSTVVYTNATTVTLNPGTYSYVANGNMSVSTASVGQILISQTGGTGTFTSTGIYSIENVLGAIGSNSGASVSGGTIAISTTASGQTQSFTGQGEFVVSTSSVNLTFAAFSTANTSITLEGQAAVHFMKIL